MSENTKIRLYGDNGECFAEIDQATLTKEWNYLQQFAGIFSPFGSGSDKKLSAEFLPKPTHSQPEMP